MVDESIDHENDAILQRNARALLVLTILQRKIKEIPLKNFIVENESTRFFHGLHSYRP